MAAIGNEKPKKAITFLIFIPGFEITSGDSAKKMKCQEQTRDSNSFTLLNKSIPISSTWITAPSSF